MVLHPTVIPSIQSTWHTILLSSFCSLSTEGEDLRDQESVSRVLAELLDNQEGLFDSEDDDVSTTNDYSSINEQVLQGFWFNSHISQVRKLWGRKSYQKSQRGCPLFILLLILVFGLKLSHLLCCCSNGFPSGINTVCLIYFSSSLHPPKWVFVVILFSILSVYKSTVYYCMIGA